MDDELPAEFEVDNYIEQLLKLRQSDRIAYLMYPQAVRDACEEYEREKQAAQKDKSEQV
ncbi:MAG: hypothetical protein H0U54_00445 [Acidobacteria bacterium]|nr:hypothetical protein [Acidobacteriota bacterium]